MSDTPFIDIHSHLLPGIDDGASDLSMALELVDQGLADGIGTWVLTPHVLETFDAELDALLYAAYEDFRDEVARRELPVTLHMASEIMFQTDVESVKSRRTATFGDNKRYFLMEFPMMSFPPAAEEVLFNFQMARMTPIVAHPERNGQLGQDIRRVARMVDRGILMQVNARSVHPNASPPTRRAAEWMIRSGNAHFVASDAHHPKARPAHLRDAYHHIAQIAGEDTARRLCIENPAAAIEGRRIETVEPQLPEHDSWWRRLLGIPGARLERTHTDLS